MVNQTPSVPIAFTGLRIFSWVVLFLMIISMLYAGWISLSYWPEIGV